MAFFCQIGHKTLQLLSPFRVVAKHNKHSPLFMKNGWISSVWGIFMLTPDISGRSLLTEFLMWTGLARHWWERNGSPPLQTNPIIALFAVNCCKLSLGTLLSKPSNLWFKHRCAFRDYKAAPLQFIRQDGFRKNPAGVFQQGAPTLFWVLEVHTEKRLPADWADQSQSAHTMCNEAFVSAYVCLFRLYRMWV